MCLLTGSLHGSLELVYDGGEPDPNPIAQGWSPEEVTAPGADTSPADGLIDAPANVGPVTDGGRAVWQIYDRRSEGNLNVPSYSILLGPDELGELYRNGWEFETTVRAVGMARWAGFTGWGLLAEDDPGWGFSGASTRVGYSVGFDADNAFWVTIYGQRTTLEPGSGSDYHTVRMVGQPYSRYFEWFLDDVSQGILELTAEGTRRGIVFQQGSSGDLGGISNWERVSLRALPLDTSSPATTPLTGTVLFDGGDDFFLGNPVFDWISLSPATSPGVALRETASASGFYRLDVPGTDDTGTGALVSTVARNGYYLLGYPTGSDYSTNSAAVIEAAGEYAIATSRLSDFMEYDVNGAFGWFPFDTFLAGVARADGSGPPLTHLEASVGIDLGEEVVPTGTGETVIDLRGLGASADDGILLASVARNDDNVAGVIPNADGTFTVAVRQNQASNREFSPISFVYLPRADAGVPGGHFVAGGRVQSSGAAEMSGGDFRLGKLGKGQWLLSIPGHDESTGTLLLTPQFGGPVSDDNTLSYEWDADQRGWVIEARKGNIAIFGLNDGATPDERFFNFAFFARDPLTEAETQPIFDDPVARLIKPRGDSLIGNGIATATGAFIQGRELLRVEGVRPLTFDIAYNSRLTALPGPVGTSWRHNYEARLQGSDGTDVTVFWDAHRHSRFEYVPAPGGGSYIGVDEDVLFAKLEPRLPDADFPEAFWALTMKDGERYLFNLHGRLVSTLNVIRQPIDLVYDEAARLIQLRERFSEATIDLAYDTAGRVSEVTDELGRVVSLNYDAYGRLISIPAPVRSEDAVSGSAFPSVAIPDDDPTGASVTIDVPEGGTISGFQVRSLAVQHGFPSDLTITVTTPGGTVLDLPAELTQAPDIIRFDGEVFDQIGEQERMGEWTLRVADGDPGVTGTINSFSLSFIESTRRVDYTYDDTNRIVAAHDIFGKTLMGAEYDSLGRITRQIDGRPETPDAQINYFSMGGPVETTYTDPLGNEWTFLHDDAFRLLSATDPLGSVGSYTYEINGNRLSFTDAQGRETFFSYDDDGNVATMKDPLDYITNFTYDDERNVTSITDALGRSTKFTHEDGRLTVVIDALGHTDIKEYFDNGQVSLYDQEGDEFGEARIVYSLDERKRVSSSTNPNNSVEPFSEQTFTYDLAGRVIASTDFGGNVTLTRYTPSGDIRSRVDPAGNVSRNDYDHRGRLIRQINRLNQTTTFTYDGNGNILTSTNAIGETTSFVYDNDDRLIRVTNPRGSTVEYAYDALGRRIRTTDPIGRTENTIYDSVGNLIEIYDATGTRTLRIEYDARDLPVRTEDALGHVAKVEYDALMRKTRTIDPLGRATTYSYDDLDRLVSQIDPAGRSGSVTYRPDDIIDTIDPPGAAEFFLEYDPSNNLIDIFDPDGADAPESFQYNARNLLSRYLSLAGRQVDYAYDDVGRLVESDPVSSPADKTRRYTYDADDKLLTVSTPNGAGEFLESERTYDPLGRLSTYTRYREADGATVSETLVYAYDRAGNLARLIYPDGSTVDYSYDDADRLIKVTDWADRVTRVTWDDRDSVTGIEFPNGARRNLTYDAAGNLIHREDLAGDGSLIVSYAYSYDSAGRLESELTSPEPPPVTPEPAQFTYDNQNRLTAINGSAVDFDSDGFITGSNIAPHLASLSHNHRGRLTDSAAYTYLYDEEDRLERWAPQGAAESEGTRFFVNPAAALSQILTATGPTGTRRFVHGVGLFYEEDVTSGGIRVFHYDYRGSTVALSGNDGELVGQVVYTPYGRIASRTGETDTLFLYNALYGVVTSPEGLNYMRFRWYASELRRFLSRDIHIGSIANLHSFNRFAYARGNPAMYVDPEGEFWWVVGGGAAGAAIGTGVTFIADIADDGQINTPIEEYGAAAIGGAVTGAILTGTAGLGTGAALGVAALAGGAGAAAENLSLSAFREQAVDPQQLAFETVTGAAFSAAGYGAGKVAGKAGSKIYSKTFGNPGKFSRFANWAAKPAKVSRRQAVGSFSELVQRSAKEEATQRAVSLLLRSTGAVITDAVFGQPTVSQPDASPGADGREGTGTYATIRRAIGGPGVNGPRTYGEYVHFNLYLDAMRVADQPVPANPTNTLSGF